MQTLRDAYYFLQENGYINFGVLKGGTGPAGMCMHPQRWVCWQQLRQGGGAAALAATHKWAGLPALRA